jgi:hypothetical protein
MIICSAPGSVLVIKPEMAGGAKAQQIGEGVRLPVSLQAELTKRNNVSDRHFMSQLIAVDATLPARMVITMPGLVSLLSPVGTVIRQLSTPPVRTVLPTKMIGKPQKPANISTKALGGGAGRHRSLFATLLASVSDAIRHVLTRISSRSSTEFFSACPALLLDWRVLTSQRTKATSPEFRREDQKSVLTSFARLFYLHIGIISPLG